MLWRQGKHEEAERYALHSDRLAAPDDWMSQWQWRAAQAKGACRSRRAVGSRDSRPEAVSVIDQTDYIKSRGGARMSLAYVLRRAGSAQDAATVLREALELFERKGDVADASKARAELEDVSTS